MINDLVENFSVPITKATTIFNPYKISQIEPEFLLPSTIVVSTGRLTPSKNVKGLIDAYLASNASDSLCMLKEGEQKEQ